MRAAGQLGVLDPEQERTSNRVELVGYVGRRPELRFTIELEPMLTLSLATHAIYIRFILSSVTCSRPLTCDS